MSTFQLGAVSLDSTDPEALVDFWKNVLGGEIAFTSDDFVALKLEGLWLTAVRDDHYQRPVWPEGSVPKQMHLDLKVKNLDDAEAEIVGLGAEKAATQPSPDAWRVFFDPDGHPFCLTVGIPD
jgi:Glyoxalase-like domain